MESRITYILIILSISPLVLAQNKLQNGSFENGNYVIGEWPHINYRDNIDVWDHNGHYPDGESWHSPDWYDETGFPNKQAYDGDRSVGVYEYEIIEQELAGSNKLLANQIYLFSVWVNLFEWGYDDHALKFYLANNKLKYTNHLLCDWCDSDYKKIVTSPKKTIKNIELYPYPTEEWFELKFTYVPSIDYSWFGFDVIDNYTPPGDACISKELLFDKVSITETNSCATCVRTDGPMIASSPFRYHSGDAPFAVHFLDNMEFATNIVIKHGTWGYTIKNLPDVYSVNGITNPIFWDGTLNNGNQAIPGMYYWEMDLTNECGTFDYSWVFNKQSAVTEPIPVLPDYHPIITPLPCCTDLPDILIDYDLYGSGLIEFIAVDDITLQNMTVESSVDILILQAGNSITFLPGTTIEQGAVVQALIQPCSED